MYINSHKHITWEGSHDHHIMIKVMIKVPGKGRACIPEDLIKA